MRSSSYSQITSQIAVSVSFKFRPLYCQRKRSLLPVAYVSCVNLSALREEIDGREENVVKTTQLIRKDVIF